MLATLVKNAKHLGREFSELERLLLPENKKLRTLVFYAESGIYYRYYEDYLDYILRESDLQICYISSDLNDPIFSDHHARIEPFYIKHLLMTAFSHLDGKVMVIATPDLNNASIKRAPKPVHHVYAFRGISSTHQGYRHGAFDNYDSVLCVAQYQIDELRRAEELYGTPKKTLILTGYPLLDRIYREHLEYKNTHAPREKKLVLVAPTWAPTQPNQSIMENCIEEIIQQLDNKPYDVWIRPHPEFAKRKKEKMAAIQNRIARSPNISIQSQLSSMECLHLADVLLTDHSSISMDFALGTERPVLFINTPTRMDNPGFTKFGFEPVETKYRSKLGIALDTDKLSDLPASIQSLLDGTTDFSSRVTDYRNELVANFQHSAEVGGNWILSLCK